MVHANAVPPLVRLLPVLQPFKINEAGAEIGELALELGHFLAPVRLLPFARDSRHARLDRFIVVDHLDD